MTKAMILAAGRGSRMRPLTDSIPKAMIEVGGKPLIGYHLDALSKAGIRDVTINLAHLGEQIKTYVQSHFGHLTLHFSPEPEGGYQTGGGIFHALPFLGDEPFVVVNADIWIQYDFSQLPSLKNADLAHIVLADNPRDHPAGDFYFQDGRAYPIQADRPTLTFVGLSRLHPTLFANCTPGIFHLGPLLRKAAAAKQLSAEHFTGQWENINTPDCLERLV